MWDGKGLAVKWNENDKKKCKGWRAKVEKKRQRAKAKRNDYLNETGPGR